MSTAVFAQQVSTTELESSPAQWFRLTHPCLETISSVPQPCAWAEPVGSQVPVPRLTRAASVLALWLVLV